MNGKPPIHVYVNCEFLIHESYCILKPLSRTKPIVFFSPSEININDFCVTGLSRKANDVGIYRYLSKNEMVFIDRGSDIEFIEYDSTISSNCKRTSSNVLQVLQSVCKNISQLDYFNFILNPSDTELHSVFPLHHHQVTNPNDDQSHISISNQILYSYANHITEILSELGYSVRIGVSYNLLISSLLCFSSASSNSTSPSSSTVITPNFAIDITYVFPSLALSELLEHFQSVPSPSTSTTNNNKIASLLTSLLRVGYTSLTDVLFVDPNSLSHTNQPPVSPPTTTTTPTTMPTRGAIYVSSDSTGGQSGIGRTNGRNKGLPDWVQGVLFGVREAMSALLLYQHSNNNINNNIINNNNINNNNINNNSSGTSSGGKRVLCGHFSPSPFPPSLSETTCTYDTQKFELQLQLQHHRFLPREDNTNHGDINDSRCTIGMVGHSGVVCLHSPSYCPQKVSRPYCGGAICVGEVESGTISIENNFAGADVAAGLTFMKTVKSAASDKSVDINIDNTIGDDWGGRVQISAVTTVPAAVLECVAVATNGCERVHQSHQNPPQPVSSRGVPDHSTNCLPDDATDFLFSTTTKTTKSTTATIATATKGTKTALALVPVVTTTTTTAPRQRITKGNKSALPLFSEALRSFSEPDTSPEDIRMFLKR